MAEVNEEVSRLFFEANGFLVRTNLSYFVKKPKGPAGTSDIDLLVANMAPESSIEMPFILEEEHLAGISKAIIEVKGWHMERISPSLSSFDRIAYFTRPEAIRAATDFFHASDFKNILITSALVTTKKARTKAIDTLRTMSIDHVIEFKTIIDGLFEKLDPTKSSNSEVLQTLRLVKIYRG